MSSRNPSKAEARYYIGRRGHNWYVFDKEMPREAEVGYAGGYGTLEEAERDASAWNAAWMVRLQSYLNQLGVMPPPRGI